MDSSFTRLVVWLAAIMGAVGLLLYLFVFDTWVVPSDDPLLTAALEPTLRPADRILTRRGSSPKNGQLARCLTSDGSGKTVIGRVFGQARERVEINNERVYVNKKGPSSRFACPSVSVTHPVTGEPVALSCSVEDSGSATYSVLAHPEFREGGTVAEVEDGKLFLVSDNRHIHLDSRDLGQFDAAACEHVIYRLWGESFMDASRRFTILW